MSASVADLPTELVIDLRDGVSHGIVLEPVVERTIEPAIEPSIAPVEPSIAAVAPSIAAVAPPSQRYVRSVKPVFDFVVAAVLLLAVLPVLVTAALAIRLTMGPGVIYRQTRIGRHGQPFTVYKLRTMLTDRRGATSSAGWDGIDRRRTHKTTDDPRHTPLGRFLRKWSIDEMPQLLNVLRGEMSLVGPRPELVHLVERYEPWEHARHAVKPGITGLWQIRARAEGPTHLFTTLDLEYIDRLSPITDLKILLGTVPAALGAQKGQ